MERGKLEPSFMHRHGFGLAVFFAVFLFISACFGLVLVNGEEITPTDLHIVNIKADGDQEFVPTRAETVGEFINSQSPVSVSAADVVVPARDTVIAGDDFEIEIHRAKPTTIIDGSAATTLLSAYEDPREAVEKAGFKLFDEDIVNVEYAGDPATSRILGRKIVITRSKAIGVTVYGSAVEHRTVKATVAEVLEEMNIKPKSFDNISPHPDTLIANTSYIHVTRPGKQVVNVEEAIAVPEEVTEDANVSKGRVTVVQEGAPGRKFVVYEITTENGKEVARRAIQEIVITPAKVRKVVRGTRPLFAEYNADGIPARVFCGSPKQGNWKNIDTGNAAAARTIAASKYGWSGAQFDALLELWACESSWNERAGNPYSGAYGIPQSWPAEKMSDATRCGGIDYLTNPVTQINWGLCYISRVHGGTPISNLEFHYRNNYY